tara:strand:+ start:5654 stop:6328 length:675 start_codon:yes stop_codon:yes gene_type:complete
MQLLACLHTPVYKKSAIDSSIYALDHFLKVTAAVHTNAPFASAWNALMHMKTQPAVVFVAGDKTTYSCLCDAPTQSHEVWNFDFSKTFHTTRGNKSKNNLWLVQNETAILFMDVGLMRTLPIPDKKTAFLPSIPVRNFKFFLSQELERQKEAFTRIRDNFQFVDLYNHEIVDSKRIEGGRVQKKQKRNAEKPTLDTSPQATRSGNAPSIGMIEEGEMCFNDKQV